MTDRGFSQGIASRQRRVGIRAVLFVETGAVPILALLQIVNLHQADAGGVIHAAHDGGVIATRDSDDAGGL